MILRTGVDLIEINRIEQALTRHGDRFLARIYTPQEIALCQGNLSSLAVRYAAKEAVSKALGTGIGAVSFQDIEVLRTGSGAPELFLRGEAARLATEQKLDTWSISLSHTQTHAIAMVVAASSAPKR